MQIRLVPRALPQLVAAAVLLPVLYYACGAPSHIFSFDSFPDGCLIAAGFFARLRGKGPRLPEGVRERVEERILQLSNYVNDEPELAPPAPSPSPSSTLETPDPARPRAELSNLVAVLQALTAAVEAQNHLVRHEIREKSRDCRQLLDEMLLLLDAAREKIGDLRTLFLEISAAADDGGDGSPEEQVADTFRPYLIVNK